MRKRENLVDLEKCEKNAPFLAIRGLDTAEIPRLEKSDVSWPAAVGRAAEFEGGDLDACRSGVAEAPCPGKDMFTTD